MISKVELYPLGQKKVRNRKNKLTSEIKQIFSITSLKLITISLITVFVSRVSIMDGLTPFGIAFLFAYVGRYGNSILIPIASSVGLFSIQGYDCYQYLTIIWISYIINIFFINKFNKSLIKLSFISFITLTSIRLIFMFFGEFFLYDLVMIGFEGVIVFTLTYIFSYSISTIKSSNRVFTNEEIICGAIMISLAISGLEDLTLMEFSLQNIAGAFLIILFSYSKGPAMGTVVGVTVGVVCGMSTPDMPLFISALGFSGLLAGLFKDLGKIGTCLGFVLGNGIISFYMNGYNNMFIRFEEVLIATVLLILLSKVIRNFENSIIVGINSSTKIKDKYNNRVKDITFSRLKEISQVFEELGATFNRVADKEKIIQQVDISKFVDTVASEVCENCSMRRFCWENDFYTTYYSMFNVMNSIETNGSISKNNLPTNLKKRCIKPDDIANKSNYIFDIYKLNYEWENKILESRQLVSQQLDGVSKIIRDLANEIQNEVSFKEDVEKNIFSSLKNCGIDVKVVIVTESNKENFEIILEITTDENRDESIEKAVSIVSDTVGFKLVRNKFANNKSKDSKRVRFKLIRCNKFGAITKISKSDESFNYISGDNYTFGERANNYYVALSDGMGMGQKANQESDITISLLEKFIEAGFDKELTLRTINSILVLKSTEEIFTTIDMSMIDLYTAKAQFIKIGSAPTFIKKKNGVKVINSHSLPVGILKEVDFQIYEQVLEDGDFIITMSDGVLDANVEEEDKEGWMVDFINTIDSNNPQLIADKIIKKSKHTFLNQEKDDMTVLVTKIWKMR